jgi:glutamyl-tRNA reductase
MAEEIRKRELNKALRMLGEINDKQEKIIDDLTRVLVERVLYHPILNLRKAALNGDSGMILVAQKLFELKLSERRI